VRPGPARGLPRDVWVLGAISLAVAVGFGIVVPVLPTFAAGFGVGNFAAAAVVAAFAAMRLVCSPLVGRFDDALGERAVLTLGLVIVAVSSAFAGLSQTYAQLLVLRGLGGLGSAMFSVAALTLLLGAAGPERRGRAAAAYQSGFLIGAILGPAIGGVFSRISMRAPFFFYAGTLAIAAAVAALGLAGGRKPADDAGARPGPARPLREVAGEAGFQAACVASLSHGWTSHGVRSSLVPLFVASALFADPKQAAWWTGVAMAVAAAAQALAVIPAGSVVDRLGPRRPMIAGSLISAAAVAAIPATRSIWALTAVLVVYALASAIQGTAPAAVVGDVAGPGGDRAVAAFSMSGDVGSIAGPLVAGALADAFSYTAAFATGAVLWGVSAAMAARWRPGPR
jgi:MFS family permease